MEKNILLMSFLLLDKILNWSIFVFEPYNNRSLDGDPKLWWEDCPPIDESWFGIDTWDGYKDDCILLDGGNWGGDFFKNCCCCCSCWWCKKCKFGLWFGGNWSGGTKCVGKSFSGLSSDFPLFNKKLNENY